MCKDPGSEESDIICTLLDKWKRSSSSSRRRAALQVVFIFPVLQPLCVFNSIPGRQSIFYVVLLSILNLNIFPSVPFSSHDLHICLPCVHPLFLRLLSRLHLHRTLLLILPPQYSEAVHHLTITACSTGPKYKVFIYTSVTSVISKSKRLNLSSMERGVITKSKCEVSHSRLHYNKSVTAGM